MEKDLGKLKKNDNTEIIIRIDDFGGKSGLTIREYVVSEKYTGFTKSGTRIPAEAVKQFKEIINSVNESDLVSDSKAESRESKPSKKPKKEDKKTEEVAEEDLL
jgi:hypothetical protein